MDQLPDRPTKWCSHCRRYLPPTEFNRRERSRDGRQAWCRECNAKRSRRFHRENRAVHNDAIQTRSRRVRSENQQRMYEYLCTHSCVDCAEDDPVVLEFDHVRGVKVGNVSAMIRGVRNWPTIELEIAKCDVVCANCHRRRTYLREGSHRADWGK